MSASSDIEYDSIDLDDTVILEPDEIIALTPSFQSLKFHSYTLQKLTNFQHIYYLESRLGEGSFGSVYGYRHAVDHKPYTIKFFPLKDKYKFPAVLREVAMLKDISTESTGVSKYYDSFAIETAHGPINLDNVVYHYCIVLEQAVGMNLHDYIQNLIDQNKYPLVSTVIHIAEWLFTTVGQLHNIDVVHRDIKPSNIIFDVEKKQLVLIDYGLACYTVENTSPYACGEEFAGSPYYAAPEVWDHDISDVQILKKSDIWSIGITLYELVTRRVPYQELQSHARLHAEIRDIKFSLHYHNRKIKDLILWCLEKDYELRPTAAEALSVLSSIPRIPRPR